MKLGDASKGIEDRTGLLWRVSLAIYMHGVTRELWQLARASRDFHTRASPRGGVDAVYLLPAAGGERVRLRSFNCSFHANC